MAAAGIRDERIKPCCKWLFATAIWSWSGSACTMAPRSNAAMKRRWAALPPGTLETVRLLMEAGADANAIAGRLADFPSTALDGPYDRLEIWEYLRQPGAKPWKELKPFNQREMKCKSL